MPPSLTGLHGYALLLFLHLHPHGKEGASTVRTVQIWGVTWGRLVVVSGEATQNKLGSESALGSYGLLQCEEQGHPP